MTPIGRCSRIGHLLHFQIQYNIIVANGASTLEQVLSRRIASAKQTILFVVYDDKGTPSMTIQERDNQIYLRFEEGEKMTTIAGKFGLSIQRISQILKTKTHS